MASTIFGVRRCGSQMNDGLVTGVAWRTRMAVLLAALIGGRWWLAVPHGVGSSVTEQSEQWGARRGGEGIGFILQRQIRRGGGRCEWEGGETVGGARPGVAAVGGPSAMQRMHSAVALALGCKMYSTGGPTGLGL
jgi:hypothetical protein